MGDGMKPDLDYLETSAQHRESMFGGAVVLELVARIREAERQRDEYDTANRDQRETFQVAKSEMQKQLREAEKQCAENATAAQKALEREVLGRSRIAKLEAAIRLHADAFDESDMRHLGVT